MKLTIRQLATAYARLYRCSEIFAKLAKVHADADRADGLGKRSAAIEDFEAEARECADAAELLNQNTNQGATP